MKKKSKQEIGESISIFVDTIINKKVLAFSTNDYSFDEELVKKKYLSKEGENYKIENYSAFSLPFLKKYKSTFNFEIQKDFKLNTNFLKQISDDFNKDNYIFQYNRLEDELWEIIVQETNKKFNCHFNEYLSSFKKEDKSVEIFKFIKAYSTQLNNLQISADYIYKNSILLLEFAKSDATYNMPLGEILNGVKQKCLNNYSFGIDLFKITITNQETNDNLISAIVSGLYENRGSDFYESELKSKIKNKEFLNGIFFGLSNVNEIKEYECNLFIKLFDEFKNNDDLIISLLALIISILKVEKDVDEKYSKKSFSRLKKSVENENVIFYILNNISYLENHIDEKVDIIVSIIEQEFFSIKKHLKAIEQVFWRLKDIESLKIVILAIAKNRPFVSISESFQSTFSRTDNSSLDSLLIELLTDNDAAKRFIAVDIFNKLSFNNPYKFTIDILKLEPIIQYKLWVALTQDYKEPKYIIPALLPLIDSKSEIVSESFAYKLEELSEEYGGHITTILDNHLNKTTKHIKIIEQIKSHIDLFYRNNITLKHKIKELNPYYTSYKQVNHFNDLFYKNMSKTIQKGAEKNSLLSVLGVNTVQLSKGGGWKFGNKKEISKLGSVGSSFSLPRSYYINPNKYELEKGLEMRTNWKESDFEIIKNILSDEQ